MIFRTLYKLLEYLVAVVLIFCFRGMVAQDVSLKVALDTSRALIGDQLKLRIMVDKPVPARIEFPQLQDSLGNKVEIIEISAVDTMLNAGGRMVLSQNFLLTVFDTGFYTIPALGVAVLNGQEWDTIQSRPITFEIVSLPTDTTIREIKPNLKAPVSLAEAYPYILGVVLVALLSWLLVYYVKKKYAHKPVIAKKIRIETPDELALRQLEHLRNDKPWLQKQVKLYFIELTGILREYIEGRFNIMAMEQTTDEILNALKSTACKEPDRKLLSGLLRLADLVKFAKVVPDQTENADQVETAIVFVRNSAEKQADNVESAAETTHQSSSSNATS